MEERGPIAGSVNQSVTLRFLAHSDDPAKSRLTSFRKRKDREPSGVDSRVSSLTCGLHGLEQRENAKHERDCHGQYIEERTGNAGWSHSTESRTPGLYVDLFVLPLEAFASSRCHGK